MSATPSDRPDTDPRLAGLPQAPEAQHRGSKLVRSTLVVWGVVFLLALVFVATIIAFALN
jgi:hypothetical protein